MGLALQSPVVLAEVEVAHGKVYFRKINEQKPIYLSFFSYNSSFVKFAGGPTAGRGRGGL